MTQPLGLQILTKVLGDQSRSAIRHQSGPIRQPSLAYPRSLTSRLDDLGEVSSTHRRLKPPGQDSAAEIIQDRDQIVPAPVLDPQIGRIRLPLLVDPGGLDPIFRFGRKAQELNLPDQSFCLQDPIDGGFRHRKPAVIRHLVADLPWGPLWKQQCRLQDPVPFLGQDLIPDPSGSRGAVPESSQPPPSKGVSPPIVGRAGDLQLP